MTPIWKRSERRDHPTAATPIRPLLWFVHREIVLLTVLSIVAVLAFAGTKLTARQVHGLRQRDAAAWHEIGIRELEAGRTAEAETALRRAAVLDAEDGRYHLALARALAANGNRMQATHVLLRIRERQPEDAIVNLALARLEASGGDAATAIRYYQHTLAALWSDTQNERRPQVRLELIEFLMKNERRSPALSELLALSPTVPDDPAMRARLGRLFLQVGDPRRAADQFAIALRADGANGAALAGAAEAAFEQEQYARARQLLARAPDSEERVRELRTIVAFVYTRDPLAPRLGSAARRDRLLANVEHVVGRLSTCGGDASSSTLRSELERLSGRLRGPRSISRDVAEEGTDLVARALETTGEACGLSLELDRALMLIARRHELRAP